MYVSPWFCTTTARGILLQVILFTPNWAVTSPDSWPVIVVAYSLLTHGCIWHRTELEIDDCLWLRLKHSWTEQCGSKVRLLIKYWMPKKIGTVLDRFTKSTGSSCGQILSTEPKIKLFKQTRNLWSLTEHSVKRVSSFTGIHWPIWGGRTNVFLSDKLYRYSGLCRSFRVERSRVRIHFLQIPAQLA